MQHVSSIRKIIEDGNRAEAHDALENLLILGPNNLEALKLQAMLYASEGRFKEEADIWSRILKVDNEDPDAVNYVFKQQTEDREHFYFTDDLPGGVRRYLTYPRALFEVSLLGFFGCIMFFTLRGLSDTYPILLHPRVILGSFALLVAAPWFAIIWIWLRAIKAVTISPEGLTVETRFRRIAYRWQNLRRLVLASVSDPDQPEIYLVLLPKDEKHRPLRLDLNDGSSSLRAKSHLVREVMDLSGCLEHDQLDALNLDKLRPYRY